MANSYEHQKEEGKQTLRKGYSKLRRDRLSTEHVCGLKGKAEKGSQRRDRRAWSHKREKGSKGEFREARKEPGNLDMQ